METSLSKWGRATTILVLVLVTGAVLYSYYKRTHLFSRPETQENKLLPENVAMATQGFSYSQSEQGRTTLEVKAKVNLGFKDNKNLYESVTVRVLGKEGNRYDTITSRRCEYDQTRQEILFLDNVVVTLSGIQGASSASGPPPTQNSPVTILYLDRVKYAHQTRRAETDGLVRFIRGQVHGNARGLTYDTQSGSIHLHSQVEIQADPSRPGDSAIQLHCDSLNYSKTDNLVELLSNVRFNKGLEEVEAGRVMIYLRAEDSSLRRIDASGSVVTVSRDPQRLMQMNARNMTYILDGRGRWVERILARESVRTHSLDPLIKRTVTADSMQIFFRPQSSLLRSLNADGNVHCVFSDVPPPTGADLRTFEYAPGDKVIDSPSMQVMFKPDGKQARQIEARGLSSIHEFPLQPKEEKKVLTASNFKFLFSERSNVLDRFTADGQVMVELWPPSAPPRKTFSDHLEAWMDVQTRQIRELHQSGRFRFQEADRSANSDEARYFTFEKRVILNGHSAVRDDRARTTAEVIEMFQTENLVKARGSVRSVLFEKNTDARPGMFQSDAPVFASADFMESQTQNGTAKYWGRAKLWQEEQVLRADVIRLFREDRKLVAEKNVSSLMYLKKTAGAAAAKSDSQPVLVRAEKLTYEDQLQRLFYETGVRARSSMGTMTAQQLEVFLETEDKQTTVQRMLAKGSVRLQQESRTSYSDTAEYFREEDRLVLLGGPPRIIDSERGFTSGARLTMYLNDDRISVEGDSGNRSITRQDVAR